MQIGQNTKEVVSLDTQITSAETHVAVIDRKGYDQCDVLIINENGTTALTNGTSIALYVKEDDTSDVSNSTTFAGFIAGTDFTLPTRTSTAVDNVARLSIDCRARKRYLFVGHTPYTTCASVIAARLSRPDSAPDSASEVGAIVYVTG